MAINSIIDVAPGGLQEDIQHLASAFHYYSRHGLPCFSAEASPDSQQRFRNYREIEELLHVKLREVKYFLVDGRFCVKFVGQRPLEHPQQYPSCQILEIVAPNGVCTRLSKPFLTFTAFNDKWLDTLANSPALTELAYTWALNKALTKGGFDQYAWSLLPQRLW